MVVFSSETIGTTDFFLWCLVRIFSKSFVLLGHLFLGHLARESRLWLVHFISAPTAVSRLLTYAFLSLRSRRQREDPKTNHSVVPYSLRFIFSLLSFHFSESYVCSTYNVQVLPYFAGGIWKKNLMSSWNEKSM